MISQRPLEITGNEPARSHARAEGLGISTPTPSVLAEGCGRVCVEGLFILRGGTEC